MRLDYSSFGQPVTRQDIERYAPHEKPLSLPAIAIVISVLWLFTWVPGFVGAMAYGKGVAQISLISPLMTGVIFAIVAVAVFYGSRLGIRHVVMMKRFAEHNKAEYAQNVMQPPLAGMIFNNGRVRTIDESLSFQDGIEIGNYTYVTGSGKRSVSHEFAFVRVALSRDLPHMVLDAKSNNYFGSNLPDTFSKDQRLTLEGDFNNYFDVYVPTGYATDALYVFTPDVMQALIDKGSRHDIEIVGNELYIFKQGKFRLDSETELSDLLSIAETIAAELRDQTKRYIDERANDRPAIGEAAANTRSVAPQGRRLRQTFPFGTLVFMVLLVCAIVVPALLPPDIADVFVLIIWPLVIILALRYMIAGFLRSR